ncbi:hypothetical protein GCM10020001_021500 [Nonomuraea salmonea]
MRHMPFVIGEPERDAWLRHMRDAVDSLDLPEEQDKRLWDYLVYAAHSLVNSPHITGHDTPHGYPLVA